MAIGAGFEGEVSGADELGAVHSYGGVMVDSARCVARYGVYEMGIIKRFVDVVINSRMGKWKVLVGISSIYR